MAFGASATVVVALMLATTPGGDSYTEEELRGAVTSAGFRDVEIEELAGFGSMALFARA